MPTTYKYEDYLKSKRLGAAIIKFLENHLQNRRLAPDQEEGLGVAMQCLALVFDATPEDAKDLPDLMEIFNKEAAELVVPSEPTQEQKTAAEEFKRKGNDFMKDKKYKEAIDEYTKAIEQNKLTEVYYCNRAAAYTNVEKFHEALDDCKMAIAINQDYAKAFSRMGLIYSKLSFFDESVSCYKDAIKLEPDNVGYKKNLDLVEVKANDAKKQAGIPGPNVDPAALAGMNAGMAAAGMPPGMPTTGMPDMMQAYQQFAGNPMFGEMAEKVMSNPEMKGLVESFMSKQGVTPPGGENTDGAAALSPMESMASAMGSGANMAELMQIGQKFAAHLEQENPELITQLRGDMMNMGVGEESSKSKTQNLDSVKEEPKEDKVESEETKTEE